MPKQTKKCRVCGKEYEACRSIKTGDTVFNWREVACSPECGKVYLQRVMASRTTALPSCNSERSNVESGHRISRKKKLENVTLASDINVSPTNEGVSSVEEDHEE